MFVQFTLSYSIINSKELIKPDFYIFLDLKNNTVAVKVINGSGNYVSIEWIKTKKNYIMNEIKVY